MSIHTEAAELAGHPSHSIGKIAALTVGTATASNVAAYQVNRKLANVQHVAPPSLSLTTGGTPSGQGAEAAGRASTIAHQKYARGVGKVHSKYTRKRKGGT